MRCLCYEDCVCGTPVIDIDPFVEVYAAAIRLDEIRRVNKRLDFLRLEGDLPARRGNPYERPSGLRFLLWELLIILGPMNGTPPKGSLTRIPNLLQSVMEILVAYHSSHFPLRVPGGTQSFCASHANDYNLEHQADVSYYLCIIGSSLRSHPSNFARIMKVPGLGNLVFTEPPPLPFQGVIIKAYSLAKKVKPTLAQREYLLGQTLMLELFSPYHQWPYLIAPIWIESIEGFESELRESMLEDECCRHCLELVQTVTSRAESHFIWGYSTLDSMMLTKPHPEHSEQAESGADIHEGKYRWMMDKCFPGLMLATLTVSRPDMFSLLANEYLGDPLKMTTVSVEVLDTIFRVLVYHFDRDERMGRIPFHDYSRGQYSQIVTLLWLIARDPGLGSSFFDRAVTQSWFTTLFVYLNKKSLRSRSKSILWYTFTKYRELYEEYGYRPRGRYRRYFGALFKGMGQRMEVFERIGCMNWGCNARLRLETIKERMDEEGFAVQDLAAEDKRLLASFKKVKLCSRCHNVAYCSRECQKADWASHRPFCRRPEKDLTENAEESAELIQRGWTANDEGLWPPYLLAKVGLGSTGH